MIRYITLFLASCSPVSEDIAPYDPVELVDVFVATGGQGAEVASVNPGAAWPVGMTLVGPDTFGIAGRLGALHCAGYWYPDEYIMSFAHTHAHGVGIVDHGAIGVMPRLGFDPAHRDPLERIAPFFHDAESGTPGRYSVTLQDDGTEVDIIASPRGALHTWDFQPGEPVVHLDLKEVLDSTETFESELTLSPDGTVSGFVRMGGGYSKRFGGVKWWFEGQFSPAPSAVGTWDDELVPGRESVAGVGVGGWAEFPEGTEQVQFAIALSNVSAEGAQANFDDEMAQWGFDANARYDAVRQAWSDRLSVVRLRGEAEDVKRFHTAHYQSLLMPNRYDDVDGMYRGIDDTVRQGSGPYLSDLSLWDTYRTLHPWYILAHPDVQEATVDSLLRMVKDGGSLPRWPLANGYTGGMVGSPGQHVIAETYLKGLDVGDPQEAFDLALLPSLGEQGNVSRSGVNGYLARGWVTPEESGGSVSQTVEAAWADYAMAEFAAALGRPEEAMLRELAGNWANHWDPELQFLVGKYEDGTSVWSDREGQEFGWQDVYIEGNAWHYVWFPFWDPTGLVNVQGDGDVAAVLSRMRAYWENVYDEKDDYFPDDYYWHGNEPVMHYPYLPARLGDPSLTADAARWVLRHRYDNTVEGLDGNDDSGTLSAWYILSSMGMFPIAGSDRYVVGSPIFERVELDQAEGTLVIAAPGTSESVRYVSSLLIGDAQIEEPEFTHAELMAGREMRFELSDVPTVWGRTIVYAEPYAQTP